MRRRMMRLKDGMLEPVFKNESVVCESETCGVFGDKVCGVCKSEMDGNVTMMLQGVPLSLSVCSS